MASGLRKITIPDSVTSIGEAAFEHCTYLRQIVGNQFFSIENNMMIDIAQKKLLFFYGNETDVTIPDTVTIIGNRAFANSKIQKISIPDKVTVIDEFAFYLCESLQQSTIPKSVTTISNYSFGWCNSLKQIIIPESVTEISVAAFYMCKKIDISNNPGFVVENNMLIDVNHKRILAYWAKKNTFQFLIQLLQ